MSISQKSKREKKRRIVEAAARVFARRGFSGTVMTDIAAGAGIGKGTIYEYFSSKEDLFFAVFEWFSNEMAAMAKVRISTLGGSASERLKALNESLMNAGVELKEFISLSMEFWAASASSPIRERFRQAFRGVYADFRQIVSSLIRDGIGRGEFRSDVDPESIAAVLVGSWDGLFLQTWFEEDFDPLTTARSFMSILIRGLVSKP